MQLCAVDKVLASEDVGVALIDVIARGLVGAPVPSGVTSTRESSVSVAERKASLARVVNCGAEARGALDCNFIPRVFNRQRVVDLSPINQTTVNWCAARLLKWQPALVACAAETRVRDNDVVDVTRFVARRACVRCNSAVLRRCCGVAVSVRNRLDVDRAHQHAAFVDFALRQRGGQPAGGRALAAANLNGNTGARGDRQVVLGVKRNARVHKVEARVAAVLDDGVVGVHTINTRRDFLHLAARERARVCALDWLTRARSAGPPAVHHARDAAALRRHCCAVFARVCCGDTVEVCQLRRLLLDRAVEDRLKRRARHREAARRKHRLPAFVVHASTRVQCVRVHPRVPVITSVLSDCINKVEPGDLVHRRRFVLVPEHDRLLRRRVVKDLQAHVGAAHGRRAAPRAVGAARHVETARAQRVSR